MQIILILPFFAKCFISKTAYLKRKSPKMDDVNRIPDDCAPMASMPSLDDSEYSASHYKKT